MRNTVTRRDARMLEFLEEYKAAHTNTLLQLFFGSAQVGYRRLLELTNAGVIKRERGYAGTQYVYYIKRPAQLRHAVALTDFYADFRGRYDVRHFAKEPTLGSIRPDAIVGYLDHDIETVAFVEVELSNKGLDTGKYLAFEHGDCRRYFDTMPKLIVVTDRGLEPCKQYDVWRI